MLLLSTHTYTKNTKDCLFYPLCEDVILRHSHTQHTTQWHNELSLYAIILDIKSIMLYFICKKYKEIIDLKIKGSSSNIGKPDWLYLVLVSKVHLD